MAEIGGQPQHSGLHVDAGAVPVEQGANSKRVPLMRNSS
jgi:hypothetical protein